MHKTRKVMVGEGDNAVEQDMVRLWGEFYVTPEDAIKIDGIAEAKGVNRRQLLANFVADRLVTEIAEWDAAAPEREAAEAEAAKNGKPASKAARSAKAQERAKEKAAKAQARADAAIARAKAAAEKSAAIAETAQKKAAELAAKAGIKPEAETTVEDGGGLPENDIASAVEVDGVNDDEIVQE